MKKGKQIAKSILVGFVIILTLFMAVGSYIMLKEVISARLPILVITLIMAIVMTLPLRRFWEWLTSQDNIVIIIICNIVAIWPLMIVSLLTINNLCIVNTEQQNVVIEKKYTQTRHRTRRVSRRTYVQGEPYKVYFIDVRLDNKVTRSIEINRKEYQSISKKDSLKVNVHHSKLGITTFDSRHIKFPPKRQKKQAKKRRPTYIRSLNRNYDTKESVM